MSKKREESGAVAIMVAIMSLVLMGTAALAVDLGQAFARKREIVHDTDLAALAGGYGSNLPTPATSGTACSYGVHGKATDQAVIDVAAYLNKQPNAPTTSAANLVDCSFANGEVMYGSVSQNGSNFTLAYDANKLTVISPKAPVSFGLGRALGQTKVNVYGISTVQISSPLISSLPLYAYTGCDFGRQTIAQPTNGQANGLLLSHPGDGNNARLTSLVTAPPTSPAAVPLDVQPPFDTLVINGTSLGSVTKVGFFESGTSSAGPEPVIMTTGFTVTNTKITIASLPTAVTGVADYWYVRVWIGTQWSDVYLGNGNNQTLAALPLTVGTPTLTCGQGSSSGNFGTLLLTNSQGPNGQVDNIAYNIAAGLEHTLGVFPAPATPFTCTAASVGAKVWPAEGSNCLDTKTGLDLNAAQEGFIDGVGGKQGKLTHVEAKTGCAANGAPATRVFGTRTINNDTLSCFLTDPTANIGDIDTASYSLPGPVLSSAIYTSPRFALVPVLGVQPANGGSNKYEVVGFRAAFITDQVNSATSTTVATASNGITGNGGSVDSIQVVFINDGALPPYNGSGPIQDYTGSGPKVLRMVN